MKALLFSGISLLLAVRAFAGPQVGTLTNVEGSVQLYSHPSQDGVAGPPPHAKFEGVYYSVQDAKVGDPLEKDNILRAQPGAKARVIFDNGDQYYVAPATSFRVSWDADQEDGKTEMALRYGKARFVIAKGGPRSRFVIRTKTAVMGVRGTDFFVAVNDDTGATETATLRGAVQVTPQAPPPPPPPPPDAGGAPAAPVEPPKATIVAAGETATVARAEENKPPQEVALHKTTQDELKAVQRNSTLPPPQQAAPPEVAEKIQRLETEAAQSTLKDIRAVDPTLAAKLEAEPAGPGKVDALNQAVVAQLETAAPKDTAAAGPIADVSIEKGVPAEPAPKEEALLFPKFWVGVKGGVANSGLGISNSLPFQAQFNAGADFAVSLERVFGRNFSLILDIFPRSTHGYSIGTVNPQAPPGGVSISATDLSVGNKIVIPFFADRRLGIYGLLGLRFVKVWSATETTSNAGILNLVNTIAFAGEAGVGAYYKWASWLRINAELRADQGVGDLVRAGTTPGITGGPPLQIYEGPLQEYSVAAGIDIGFHFQ